MSIIKKVFARQIIDSRGFPTVETEITTSEGVFSGSAPSGASKGAGEAFELRDKNRPFFGKGVLHAVRNVNKIISKKLVGMAAVSQLEIDLAMISADGTPNKRNLGENAILSTSIAACKAGAATLGVPAYYHVSKLAGTKPRMPLPQMNLINGGKHAGLKNDFQEHLLIPTGAKTFAKALEIGDEIYLEVGKCAKKQGVNTNLVADEGGIVFGNTPEERFELIEKSAEEVGYMGMVKLGVDCAATQFWNVGKKKYFLGRTAFSARQLQEKYLELIKYNHIFSIEDPFWEKDWEAWQNFTKKQGSRLQIIGDDLLTSNPKLIKKAASLRACNALLLKPNQIGSITEAILAFKEANNEGWKTIVSHRSGETEDAFIAHFAVGLGVGQCKFGAPARGERTAKYNELLRISEKVNTFGVVW